MVGIKDSSNDWDNTRRLFDIEGLVVYPGSELPLIDALELGNLENLGTLDLSHNQLSNDPEMEPAIPKELGNLSEIARGVWMFSLK